MGRHFPHLVITKEHFNLFYADKITADGTAYICASENALGEIIAELEKCYSEAKKDNASWWVHELSERVFSGSLPKAQIMGLYAGGSALASFYEFTHGRDLFSPTLKEVELYRIEHGIAKVPLPYGSEGLSFGKQQNIEQVIYSLLYFYAYCGFGLKRCKLCGKWFAVSKERAKAQYCSRPFQYTDAENAVKRFPSCQDASEKIRQRSEMRRKNIYDHLSQFQEASVDVKRALFDFDTACKEWKERIKTDSFVADDLLGYERFLYVDCAKLKKKYGR